MKIKIIKQIQCKTSCNRALKRCRLENIHVYKTLGVKLNVDI